MKKEKLIPKLIFFLLGMAIIQLGVVIFLLSGAGSDPFTDLSITFKVMFPTCC